MDQSTLDPDKYHLYIQIDSELIDRHIKPFKTYKKALKRAKWLFKNFKTCNVYIRTGHDERGIWENGKHINPGK